MRTVKTRNRAGNIKVFDKPVNLSKRMKNVFVLAKGRALSADRQAEETQNPRHASPVDYAGENVQNTAQSAARETAYQAKEGVKRLLRRNRMKVEKREKPGETTRENRLESGEANNANPKSPKVSDVNSANWPNNSAAYQRPRSTPSREAPPKAPNKPDNAPRVKGRPARSAVEPPSQPRRAKQAKFRFVKQCVQSTAVNRPVSGSYAGRLPPDAVSALQGAAKLPEQPPSAVSARRAPPGAARQAGTRETGKNPLCETSCTINGGEQAFQRKSGWTSPAEHTAKRRQTAR
jgi:hypothetical protein